MELIFDKLKPETKALLEKIGPVKVESKIETDPPALKEWYVLEFPKNFRARKALTKDGADYYYNGLKIAHTGSTNWVSTKNIAIATSKEKELEFTRDIDAFENEARRQQDFNNQLRKELYQLALIVCEGMDENRLGGFKGWAYEQLERLVKLEEKNSTWHDKIIASNKSYQILQKVFPKWTDDAGTLDKIELKDPHIFAVLKSDFSQKTNIGALKPEHYVIAEEPVEMDPPIENEEQQLSNDIKNKILLILKLEKYIKRINAHEESIPKAPGEVPAPDFKHGFWFFRNSRALNREANFYLATQLKVELELFPKRPIHEIFADISVRRNNIIEQRKINNRPDYAKRDIHSSELAAIIAAAREMDPPPIDKKSSNTTSLGH